MPLLDALAAKLVTALGYTAGSTGSLFAYQWPDDPDEATCLAEYGGPPPQLTHHATAPIAIETPRVQIMARAGRGDYPTARARVLAARNALAGIDHATLSGLRVLAVLPAGAITPAGEDDKGRPIVVCNMQVWTDPET